MRMHSKERLTDNLFLAHSRGIAHCVCYDTELQLSVNMEKAAVDIRLVGIGLRLCSGVCFRHYHHAQQN